MQHHLFATLLIIVSLPAAAQVYKCTDAEGVVTYADGPCPNVERIIGIPIRPSDPYAPTGPSIGDQLRALQGRAHARPADTGNQQAARRLRAIEHERAQLTEQIRDKEDRMSRSYHVGNRARASLQALKDRRAALARERDDLHMQMGNGAVVQQRRNDQALRRAQAERDAAEHARQQAEMRRQQAEAERQWAEMERERAERDARRRSWHGEW